MATDIEIGKKVPDFKLTDSDGNVVKLSDFRGKKVILYFYPRDNTSGCTQQACDFQANKQRLSRKKYVVLGVSPDSEESHQKFRDKHGLRFTLLSDPKKEVAKAFGVYKQKTMYGKKVMGIERSTFVIDEQGRLLQELRKVKAKGHVEDLLEAI